MSEEETKIAIAIPGEWALRKAFGPVLTEIGEDFGSFMPRDEINLSLPHTERFTTQMTENQANLRVTRTSSGMGLSRKTRSVPNTWRRFWLREVRQGRMTTLSICGRN